MISVKVLARQIERFSVDNSPLILTAVGVAGALSATFLTAKASFKSAKMIEEELSERWQMTPDVVNGAQPEYPVLTNKETFALVWKEYIPPAGVLTVTVASIICANRISSRRIAAMAAAYSLSEKAYSEYREKVVQKFNANKERQVRDEIAQDRVTNSPPKDAQIIITGNGDVLCYDLPTGRYFKSNMEKLRSVQNDLNAQVCEIGQATLSDLYVALNLTTTPYSEELGWTTDKLLEIHFSAVLTDDSQPCISIDYHAEPIRGGARFQGCTDDPDF